MIKLGFKKTKMFGLVGFIGLFVSLGLMTTVNADETQPADVTVVSVTTDDGIQVDNKPEANITPSITVYGDPNEDHTTVVEFTTDDGIQVDNKPNVTTYDDNTSVVAFETNDNIATDNKVEVITNGTDETVENAERGTINPNSGKEQGNVDTTPSVASEKTDSGSGVIASDKEQPIGNVEVPDNNIVKSRSRQQDHYITDDAKNVDAKSDISSVNNQQRKVLPHTGDDDSVAMVLFGVTVILSVLSIIINVKDLKK